ncbi:MAG: ATPase [Bacillota bacterium]
MKQDLWSIIEELEAVVADGMHIPLSDRVMVSEEEMFALIDELRSVLPGELTRARSVVEESDRILGQARTEAERIIDEARSYSDEMTAESSIAARAEEEAAQTVQQAEEMAHKTRVEAHRYADEVLAKLQGILEKATGTIAESRDGLRKMPQVSRDQVAAAGPGSGSSSRGAEGAYRRSKAEKQG